MPEKQLDELPSEAREQLSQGAQNVFLAAYNSAQANGMNEDAALSVAWNTIKHDYQKGSDGKWQKKSEDTNVHNKSIISGGN